MIQRALILRQGLIIDEHALHFESLTGVADVSQGEVVAQEPLDASACLKAPALGSGLKAREQAMILDALKVERGSRKETAARLGISPRTLRYKLARFKEMGIALPA